MTLINTTCIKKQLLGNVYFFQPGYFCQGHGPVIDGPGRFLPNYPLVQRENGEFSQVPLMSGYNSEDGSLYVLACKYY